MAHNTTRYILHAGVETPPEFLAALRDELDDVASHQFLTSHSLHQLTSLLAEATGATVIVPITAGRDKTLLSNVGRAAAWVRSQSGSADPGGICVVPEMITPTIITANLRKQLRQLDPERDVAIVASTSIDEFADAELFRLARLAWVNGTGVTVDVAFDDVFPSCAEVAARYPDKKPAIIRADFHNGLGGAGGSGSAEPNPAARPLLSIPSAAMLVQRQISTALQLLQDHHDDGIDAAVLADHEHGHAHSHVHHHHH